MSPLHYKSKLHPEKNKNELPEQSKLSKAGFLSILPEAFALNRILGKWASFQGDCATDKLKHLLTSVILRRLAPGRGHVDLLEISDGHLVLEGWGAFKINKTWVAPEGLIVLVNGEPASSLAPNRERDDVRSRLGADTALFGFAARLAIKEMDLQQGTTLGDQVQLLARHAQGGIICLGITTSTNPVQLSQSVETSQCSFPSHQCMKHSPPPECNHVEYDINSEAAEEQSASNIEEDLVEIAQVYKQGSFSQERFGLHVEWGFTDMCNYACSYCSGYKKPDHRRFPSQKKIENALNNIFSLKRPWYTFCLLGGEPTIHPHFLYLLDTIHSAAAPTASYTVTNASRSEAFFEEYASVVQEKKHFVVISYHPERASLDSVARKVKILADHGVWVSVHAMFYLGGPEAGEEKQWRQKILEVAQKFVEFRKTISFDFEIAPLIAWPAGKGLDPRYTQEDFSMIIHLREMFIQAADASGKYIQNPYPPSPAVYVMKYDNNERQVPVHSLDWGKALNNGLRCFKDFYCCSGTNEIFINHAGELFGAKCTELRSPKLNVFEPNPDWSLVPHIVKCKAETCDCPSNDCLPKFRDIASAEACILEFKQLLHGCNC